MRVSPLVIALYKNFIFLQLKLLKVSCKHVIAVFMGNVISSCCYVRHLRNPEISLKMKQWEAAYLMT